MDPKPRPSIDEPDSCAACTPIQGETRWKKFGAWTGLILFCPCHLPLTIAGIILMISAAGIPIADSWGRPLLYLVFGGSFVFFLILVVRMAMRYRDRERARDEVHALHTPSLRQGLPAQGHPIPDESA